MVLLRTDWGAILKIRARLLLEQLDDFSALHYIVQAKRLLNTVFQDSFSLMNTSSWLFVVPITAAVVRVVCKGG